jgi:hypothetical protein
VTGRSAALVFVAALVLFAAAPASAAPEIDYLYIDASEGGGSGGHAAIALGDRAFHFEHRAPGILRLRREPVDAIRSRYGMFENRTILVSHVPVRQETYNLILDELNRRYLVQQQHLADHQAAVDDRRLLEAAWTRRRGSRVEEPLMLEGAGFFFDEAVLPAPASSEEDETDSTTSPLVALRHRMEAGLAPDGLRGAMHRIRAELNALVPDRNLVAPAPLAADQLVPSGYGFARRYRDGLLKLLALEALRTARPLRPGSQAGGVLPRLAPEDVEFVERLADALQESLVRIVQSRRPDWGFPLLLGMARLIALDETLRARRWVLLDASPASAAVIRRERLIAHPAFVRALRDRVAADFDSARAWLQARGAAEGFPELEFAGLEAAGARRAEVETGLRESRDLRVAWGTVLPARGAPHREVPLPALALDDLDEALAAARAREASHAASLKRLYGYNLLTRNCVTEIFRTIEAAFARNLLARDPTLGGPELDARVRAASVEGLGGYVDPGALLNFIPAVSAAAVQSAYAVSEVEELPSYRKARMARMYGRENPVVVFLRESNTLTSTLYRRTREDSAFLFFTDDAIAARPVFGALNLVAGIGVAAAGLATLPVDHGAMVKSGLKGALFSLPELAFFNIRKGTFPILGRRAVERPDVPPGRAAGARAPGG